MTILEMSVGGALLIAAILVLRRVALYRLPKWSFLLLWVVALCRLLIPFSVPSQFSIYTGAAWIAQVMEKEETPPEPAEVQAPGALPPVTVPGTFREDIVFPSVVPTVPEPEKEPISPLIAVYLTGGALCGLFFAIVYVIGMRRFSEAEPVDSEFLDQWQEEHPTLLPVTIKTCDTIYSPMAYGLLRPVVLLPETTDWSDEGQLTYILTHEYVHIRRGDLGWKLLLTAALCLHWFNPLVWLMYIRANQDLELACDEAVVRILGLDNRKNYAYALIAAAESAFSPLYITYATQNHMEERIRAIMKMKKKSTAVILCAAMLVAGISAVFATSPKPIEPKDIEKLPAAVMSNALPNPSVSAPVEKDVSVPDTSAVVDLESAPMETDIPDVDNRIHPVTDEPAESVADTTEPAPAEDSSDRPVAFYPDDPVEFWGIPEGPIVAGTTLNAHTEGEFREMIRQLRSMGYEGNFSLRGHTIGKHIVILAEDFDGVDRAVKAPDRLMPDWTYYVNSKGETYGSLWDEVVLGYAPDLITVQAPNGVSGYAFNHEMAYFGYPGPTETREDMVAYNEWLRTQPRVIKIPIYDENRDNILGYYEAENQSGTNFPQERINEILRDLEDGLRRNTDKTDEEIAREVTQYAADRGWN